MMLTMGVVKESDNNPVDGESSDQNEVSADIQNEDISEISAYQVCANIHIDPSQASKPFACPECEYKCSYEGMLKSHMDTHKGKNP